MFVEVRRDFTEYYDDKMQRVQRKVDNLRKAISNNKKLDEKETTFMERMRLQIMQNLEITIHNLHISYETISTTKLGHPFSFGLTIYHLEMITTTNNRLIGKIKENSAIVFKMKEMHALSLYWNTECKSRIDMPFDDVVKDLKSKITTNIHETKNDEMNYILHPVNLTIDLLMILQPGDFNFERPAYDIDIQIEHLNLTIDPKQFSDLLDFIKFQNYTKLYDRCQEYRELKTQEVLDINTLTIEQKGRIRYLESKLDVFNLAYIYHNIEMETNPTLITNHNRHHRLKTNRIVTPAIPPNNNHHHKWWHSWWKTKSHSKDGERRKSSTSDSITTHEDFSIEDSPNIDIKVKVNNLVLNLSLPQINNQSQLTDNDILCPIKITDARIGFKRRAISSNISFIIDIQSFSLFGMQTDKQQARPLLVAENFKSFLPLIHSELEFSPMDKKSDYRLYLLIEPLKITYDAPTINQIVECFNPNDDNHSSILSQIKRRTNEEMEHDVSQEKVFDMTIELKGISLVLPQNGVSYMCSSIVHIDFNSLILKSCLGDNTLLSQDEVQRFRFYTKYKLGLHDLRITYAHSDEQQLHIIRQIPLLDIDFYKCIYSNDADLTDWHIAARIAKIDQIVLSKTILIKLMHHLKSVPLFYSNMIETLHRINLYFTIFPPHTTMEIDLSIQRCFLLFSQFHTSIIT
ncbi:unnamed protein product, partial [Adineta steineri]